MTPPTTDHAARVRAAREKALDGLRLGFDRETKMTIPIPRGVAALDELVAAAEAKGRAEAVAECEGMSDDRLVVKLHTLLCGECHAFPGCGEACHPATCDCCHDDADPRTMLDELVAKVKREAVAEAVRIVEGMTPHLQVDANYPSGRDVLTVHEVIAALQRQGET